ncbi:SubName: Full=Uncharacterized protein {ECO:0000313/EMBL:CCA76189.1} [Serendipita indica DSM 11827]|uniref:Uncharacterized protein n=1 Tax=Serendipita indica (strain DSM 11827) TaxID=1109443 RepID=G4TXZ6_SERID|nr:SubName: Full=Uncharacterized protein {ECO:0000313/EMBL:CCA76189.1} [Serendipita indica DSM 11827]CCA76189.1 hypothetical protein PIIN_10182 [Serendipita indica DSM 11827]
MALVPIVNSGKYKIKNVKFGAIRDDEGSLGAKGNSKSEELVWTVTLNPDNSHTLHAISANAPAIAGGPVTEVSKRFYISLENQSAQGVHWFLQPVLIGSDPRILYAIYEPGRRGHWELCSADKKEPVKLNREPHDDENKPVPTHFTPEALWVFEHVIGDE